MGTVSLRGGLDIEGVVLPQACLNVPSMISLNERKLLYHMARDHYAGWGAIVDAGIFMGSSTLAFSHALRDRADTLELLGGFRKRGTRPIHSYDRCIVTPHMVRYLQELNHPLGESLRVGETYSPLLRAALGQENAIAELHVGDLRARAWNRENPVELLFIDVAKTLPLHAHIGAQFLPALRPGSYVVHQDFFYSELPWIKVTMAHLRDHFELVGEAHASAVFRCTNVEWQDRLDLDPWDHADLDELVWLHDSWIGSTADRRRRAMIELSAVRLMLGKGGFVRAADRLRHVERAYEDILALDTGYASLAEKVDNTWSMLRVASPGARARASRSIFAVVA